MNNPRFIHLRQQDSQGNPENHGGNTIAYVLESAGVVNYAISQCSDHDQYSRYIGRAVSLGRLENGKSFSFQIHVAGGSVVTQIIEHAKRMGLLCDY